MSNYPHDLQSDDGSTAVDGRGNVNVSRSTSHDDRVILWTFPGDADQPLVITYLSPEGALAIAKAIKSAAYDILTSQVEASA